MKRLIFGCGYLGCPTAKRWVESGDQVFGVTRHRERFAEFESVGVLPILADVTDESSLEGLPAVDTVLLAVGMDRSSYSDIRDVYVTGLANVLRAIPAETGQLIYVSTTGVYGDFAGGWVDEESPTHPTREGGRASLEAESLIWNSRFSARAAVLRFAGIYGPQRVPNREAVVNREWDSLSSEGHLNLIHVADGARVIDEITAQQTTGETINVSDGQPTLRKTYYETMAELVGSGPIDWPEVTPSPGGRNDKRISNEKLRSLVPGDFLYPDFRTGLTDALIR